MSPTNNSNFTSEYTKDKVLFSGSLGTSGMARIEVVSKNWNYFSLSCFSGVFCFLGGFRSSPIFSPTGIRELSCEAVKVPGGMTGSCCWPHWRLVSCGGSTLGVTAATMSCVAWASWWALMATFLRWLCFGDYWKLQDQSCICLLLGPRKQSRRTVPLCNRGSLLMGLREGTLSQLSFTSSPFLFLCTRILTLLVYLIRSCRLRWLHSCDVAPLSLLEFSMRIWLRLAISAGTWIALDA